MNLIGCCFNFVAKINLDFLSEKKKDEIFVFLDLIRNKKVEFFEIENEEIKEKCNSLRENVIDYLKNFNFFLKILCNLKFYFIEMIEREIFLFKNENDFNELRNKIEIISADIFENSGINDLKNSKILKDLIFDENFGVKDNDNVKDNENDNDLDFIENKNLDILRKFIFK